MYDGLQVWPLKRELFLLDWNNVVPKSIIKIS